MGKSQYYGLTSWWVWLQVKHLFGTLGPSQGKAETTINDGSSLSARDRTQDGLSVNR